MGVRFRGSFLGRNNTEWEVKIMDRDWSGAEGELTFPAEEPLVIEWEHRDKHESVCGSTATLKVESMEDREFVGLYTIEAGRIWMEVRRDGLLFWTGSLDSEFYEEPYSREKNYDVQFVFSDFGLLDRLSFEEFGEAGAPGNTNSVRSLIEWCSKRSNLEGLGYEEKISLQWSDGRDLALSDIYVKESNWRDEYGEALTLMEVLEGVLQPLGLKIIQAEGTIMVVDLQYMYSKFEAKEVEWCGTDQMLRTDKVYNKARITFSPYGSGSVDFGEIKMKQGAFDFDSWKPFNEMFMFREDRKKKGYTGYYSHCIEKESEAQDADKGFSVFWDSEGSGVDLGCGRYCYIHAFGSGESTHCIAEVISDYDCLSLTPTYANFGYVRPTDGGEPERLFSSSGRIEACSKGVHWLRLTLEMLADVRYNPFSTDDRTNGWYDYHIKERSCWVYIPVRIEFRGDDGRVQHYKNSHILFGSGSSDVPTSRQCGYWTRKGGVIDAETVYAPGADNRWWHFDSYISYYNTEDRWHDSGIGGGWKKNKASIGRYFGELGRAWKSRGDGEFIPLPTDENGNAIGGVLTVSVYCGALIYDDDDLQPKNRYDYVVYGTRRSIDGQEGYWDNVEAWQNDESLLAEIKKQPFPLHWMLFKQVEMDIVSRRTWQVVEVNDLETTGLINEYAKEDIDIDTICGTGKSLIPMARGVYVDSRGLQVRELMRSGRTATAEHLLIGTLLSQYGDRKSVLSGTAEMAGTKYMILTDKAMAGVLFLKTAERLDCCSEESELELTELSEDSYGIL